MNRVFLFFLCVLSFVSLLFADPRMWGESGLTVRQTFDLRWEREFARRDNGDHIVVWSDTRNGNRDIFGQLINGDGVAQWPAEGVPLVAIPHGQDEPRVCWSGDEFVVIWQNREIVNGNVDRTPELWMQRFDVGGNALWPMNDGVGIRVADSVEYSSWNYRPAIHADGQGGVIFTWLTPHVRKIIAERYDQFGSAVWNEPLLVADSLSNYESYMNATYASDHAGNVFVAWHDRDTNGRQDIFAAKITPDGNLPWGSGAGGIPISTAIETQHQANIVADGVGGCFVQWTDWFFDNLYAQHVSATGQTSWVENGVLLCSGNWGKNGVAITASFNGTERDGFIATWADHRDELGYGKIYAQKINEAGLAQWVENGIPLCTDYPPDQENDQESPQLVTDSAGGAIVCFDIQGSTEGRAFYQPFVNRISGDGNLIWSAECGLPADTISRQRDYPILSISANGNPQLLWHSLSSSSQRLKVQILDSQTGVAQLEPNGRAQFSCVAGYGRDPRAFTLGNGRVGVIWQNANIFTAESEPFYQVLNSAGEAILPANGLPLICGDCPTSGAGDEIRTCADGNGGAFVVWPALVQGYYELRVQRMNENGQLQFAGEGLQIWPNSPESQQQERPYCAQDGAGGCYVAWRYYDIQFNIGLQLMRLNSNGERMWREPVTFDSVGFDTYDYDLATGPDQSVWFMVQYGVYPSYQVRLARVAADGQLLWNREIVPLNGSAYPRLAATTDGRGYVVWNHSQDNGIARGVRAQLLDMDGNRLWPDSGLSLIASPRIGSHTEIALDTENGLWVVCQDRRIVAPGLYAQHVDAAGNLRFTGGLLLMLGHAYANSFEVLSDGNDGLIASWMGTGEDTDRLGVFATHIDAAGEIVDEYYSGGYGGLIGGLDYSYPAPTMALDGAGGAICVWQDVVWKDGGDEGNHYYRIQAQRIDDGHITDIDEPAPLPSSFALQQNFPNPFNPITEISYSIPAESLVRLEVYDITGRLVTQLVHESQVAGNHRVTFDARNFSSGLYFYRLTAGEISNTRKMVLLK